MRPFEDFKDLVRVGALAKACRVGGQNVALEAAITAVSLSSSVDPRCIEDDADKRMNQAIAFVNWSFNQGGTPYWLEWKTVRRE